MEDHEEMEEDSTSNVSILAADGTFITDTSDATVTQARHSRTKNLMWYFFKKYATKQLNRQDDNLQSPLRRCVVVPTKKKNRSFSPLKQRVETWSSEIPSTVFLTGAVSLSFQMYSSVRCLRRQTEPKTKPYTMLLFIIRVTRELKRVCRNGCRYNERLNTETRGSKTSRIHWVTRVNIQ
jgi:hypothetical protein